MKASEFRIGNWVNYHDDDLLFEVTRIDDLGIGVKNSEPETAQETWIEYECFSPIPLTEEWLLKFGFEKVVYDSEETGYGTDYELEIVRVGFLSYSDDFSCALFSSKRNQKIELGVLPNFDSIKTVHGLQNLYFALTNEELHESNTSQS